MFSELSYWGGMAAMAATCLFALARGGALEKQAGCVIAVAWIASALAPTDLDRPLWAVSVIDLLLLAYFLYHAAFSKRGWPMWAAGFQLLIVATHFAFVRNPALEQWGYLTAYYIWSLLVLVSLFAGTLWRPRLR